MGMNKNVELRRITIRDMDDYCRITEENYATMSKNGVKPVIGEDKKMLLFGQIQRSYTMNYMYTAWRFAVCCDNKFVGMVSIKIAKIDDKSHSATIGYSIDRRMHSQGIGTEVIRKILLQIRYNMENIAGREVNVRWVEADVLKSNTASRIVLERNGFGIVDDKDGVYKYRRTYEEKRKW